MGGKSRKGNIVSRKLIERIKEDQEKVNNNKKGTGSDSRNTIFSENTKK